MLEHFKYKESFKYFFILDRSNVLNIRIIAKKD